MSPLAMFWPLFASMILIAFMSRESSKIRYIALLGSFSAIFFVSFILQNIGSTVSTHWFTVGNLKIDLVFSFANANAILFILVAAMSPIIFLYSLGFMDRLSEQKNFYLEMLGFEIAMLLFSISGNFITLILAWELLSITSYLLIGFWNYKDSANRAARKTISIIVIGDTALFAAALLLFQAYGAFDFVSILGSSTPITPISMLALILLIVAIFTKSAQFPFQEWLPDAMEGPTPVSAYLHSSTMVKAGVFLFLIFAPMFILAKLNGIVIVIAFLTAALSILNGIGSNHIKRVLAYSTIEELSVMLIAISIGAYTAALYFFVAQTFYKALLFFYAGQLIKNSGKEDLNEIKGVEKNRLLFAVGAVGILALAGFLPFNGFFANVEIESASSYNMLVYFGMLSIDLLVSFMMGRWFFIPLKSEKKAKYDYSYLNKQMTYAALLCALLIVITSLLFVPGFLGQNIQISHIVIETALVAIGAFAAYKIYYGNALKLPFSMLFENNLIFQVLYRYVSIFIYLIADTVEWIDMLINDFFDSIGKIVYVFGYGMSGLESGSISLYIIVFVFGALVLSLALVLH